VRRQVVLHVAAGALSALFAAGTLVSSTEAVSLADAPSTSRMIRAARCLGVSS
jgi:hypothetical protein